MKKKEEAKEKGGGKEGENSVKQDGKELEPGWKGRKNGEVREEKTANWKKLRLIWAYFFAMYLNYLKDRFFVLAGYGFPLVPLETEGSLPFRWKYCVCIYTGMQSGMFV